MKLKKLFNADVLQENYNNKVDVEHIKNIVPSEPCYVEHSIYFADSLCVYEDETKTKTLIQESDYVFAEMDTIASEQSNKDCYRAIIFLTDITEAYISYHSYGDIVSAEILNEIITEVNNGVQAGTNLGDELRKVKEELDEHIKGNKEHSASDTVLPETIALRTKNGTVKVADPTESDDAVNLQKQTQAIQKAQSETRKEISKARNDMLLELEIVDKKVKAEKPVLEVADFYPNEMTQEDVDALPADEKKAIINQATTELNNRVSEIKPFYNVVRNENGGVTVSDAVNENEAVNKKAVDIIQENLTTAINNVKTKADNNKTALDELTETVSQIDTSSNYVDRFVFDSTKEMGTRIETNKMWAGKKVYRIGVTVEGTGNNNSYWTPISNDYTIINAFGVNVSSSGVSKGISFSDVFLTKGNSYPLYYFYVYSERYTTCYLSFEYVE